MKTELARLKVKLKTGNECFHSHGASLGYTLLDFWRWSVSDLVSNATRGRLAEFIVAKALGISTDDVRDEWAAYDLISPDGVKVEVKSAAYVQSWSQKRYSSIQFLTRKTRPWDPDTGLQAAEAKRQAEVYVFALLAHKVKANLDPLDLSQWRFYVLPTVKLDDYPRSQHSITLKSLEGLCGEPTDHRLLRGAVVQAADEGKKKIVQQGAAPNDAAAAPSPSSSATRGPSSVS
jgi:hypothetical protein